MRLAETVRNSSALCFVAGAGIVAALALRPQVHPATSPIVAVEPTHELTMRVDDIDCASDVNVVDGRFVVTLEVPDRNECTKSVRVYHLENDHLVFEHH